jgi:hypothetical protein
MRWEETGRSGAGGTLLLADGEGGGGWDGERGDIRGDEEEEGTVGEERGDRGWGLREEGAGARVVADCSILYIMET